MSKTTEAQPEPAADDARPVAPPHPMADLVDRWWADHFPGSSVAHSTDAWNHAYAAVADLKRRLIDGSK